MITCPYCRNKFQVFDKNTHERLLDFELKLDTNFNGMYIFNCPNCNKRFSEFPWNVFNYDSR